MWRAAISRQRGLSHQGYEELGELTQGARAERRKIAILDGYPQGSQYLRSGRLQLLRL